jgi:hypothetical protein
MCSSFTCCFCYQVNPPGHPDGLSHPFGISVLDQHLYWTDWGTLSVQRVDKNTALNRATIQSSLGTVMDIKAWKVITDGNAIHRPLDFHLTSSGFEERLPFQMDPYPNKERSQRKSGQTRALGRLSEAHMTGMYWLDLGIEKPIRPLYSAQNNGSLQFNISKNSFILPSFGAFKVPCGQIHCKSNRILHENVVHFFGNKIRIARWRTCAESTTADVLIFTRGVHGDEASRNATYSKCHVWTEASVKLWFVGDGRTASRGCVPATRVSYPFDPNSASNNRFTALQHWIRARKEAFRLDASCSFDTLVLLGPIAQVVIPNSASTGCSTVRRAAVADKKTLLNIINMVNIIDSAVSTTAHRSGSTICSVQ